MARPLIIKDEEEDYKNLLAKIVKKNEDSHEAARSRITGNDAEGLTCAELRILCRSNGLKIGKAYLSEEKEKEILKQIIIDHFSLMSPDKLIRADLSSINREDVQIQKEIRQREKKEQIRCREDDEIYGKYFAHPSPTSRAACRECREVISKGTVRVGMHYILNKDFQHHARTSYFHAVCFMKQNEVSFDREWPKDLVYKDGGKTEEADQLPDLAPLLDCILALNKKAIKDKEWQKQQRAAITLSWPSDIITNLPIPKPSNYFVESNKSFHVGSSNQVHTKVLLKCRKEMKNKKRGETERVDKKLE